MKHSRIYVAKIGGSLLDLPDLPDRLKSWRAAQPASHIVFVVGGGKIVDAVRDLYQQRAWGDASAHWLCVELLSVTTRIVGAWIPEWARVDSIDLLRRQIAQEGSTLFQPISYLRAVQSAASHQTMPATWDVTSDSIAGRVAIELGADKLLLLKSCLPPDAIASNSEELAEAGYVDRLFPKLAPQLPPWCAVDFRAWRTKDVKTEKY